MKILCVGDIMGRPGRRVVRELLPDLLKKKKIDYCIANGENMAHGKGFTTKTVTEMQKAGIDFFTGGNHSFDVEEFMREYKKDETPVIRPENYGNNVPGKGHVMIETKKGNILLINLIGRILMDKNYEDPFKALDDILEEYKERELEAIILDFHAETTAEKYTMREYVKGKVSVMFGTHTHVPTADAHISEGLGYITDLGMCGAVDSSIGLSAKDGIEKFRSQGNVKMEMETKFPYYLRALVVECENKICKSIELIQLKIEH